MPVLQRGDTDAIRTWIQTEPEIALSLPQLAIDQWKQQFGRTVPMPTAMAEPTRKETPLFYLKQAAKAALGRS